MNQYKIVYRCNNGFEGEEIVNAANRTMAFEMFAKVEYFKDVVAVDCFRIIEEQGGKEAEIKYFGDYRYDVCNA